MREQIQIEINLFADYLDWIGAETDRLRAYGFRFQTYEEWKSDSKQRHPSEGTPESEWTDSFKLNRMYLYENFRRRFIDERPRKIEYAKDIDWPDECLNGLMLLETRIRKGQSLFPHMSTQLFIPNSRDDMLLEWGIHHFHLGDEVHPNHPQMVSRTGDLIYALVEPDTVYFIALSPHGRWADIELLNIVYRDFPQLLLRYEMKGLSPQSTPLTEEERRTLRKKGYNVMVDIDGRVFSPPGELRNCAGGRREVVFEYHRRLAWYEAAERAITEAIQRKFAEEGAEKTPLPRHMKLKMFVHEDRQLVLHDKENSWEVILHLRENGRDYDYLQIRTLL